MPGILLAGNGVQRVRLTTSPASESRLFRKCGSLDASEASGPPWPVTGIGLPYLTMDFTLHTCKINSRDSSVGIATGYTVEVRLLARKRDISPLNNVRTGSGAHPASCPVGPVAFAMQAKQLGLETDHSPPSSVEVETGGAVPPLPICRTALHFTSHPKGVQKGNLQCSLIM
jgi:hypothetical protein